MKKLASLVGAGALLLSMAGGAMAWWFGSDDVDISNWAFVTNKVTTKADSGDNDLGGKYVWGGSIKTGAAGATSLLGNDVNSSIVACDGCDGDVTIHNGAMLYSDLYTKADSGDNELGGKCVGGGLITTGAAGATSVVDNLVNFSVVGGSI